jgi:hypothetical protein
MRRAGGAVQDAALSPAGAAGPAPPPPRLDLVEHGLGARRRA